ncbi:MAG: hypothetical protein AAGJ28_07145 [Pseudomonadota bacterium]
MRTLTILTAAMLATAGAAHAGDYKANGAAAGYNCNYSAVTAEAKTTKPQQTVQAETPEKDEEPTRLAQSKPVSE